MEKLTVIVLCFLIITLSACKERENKLFDISDEVYSSDTLLFVTDKETYSQDETVISYSITNIGDGESSISADENCFEIHKLCDGKWKRLAFKKEISHNFLARILKPEESETRKIELEDYFYLPLEQGSYRISVDYMISNTFEITE